MAKLGRYAAQRRKVEAITDDKTVEVADCGTLFFCRMLRTRHLHYQPQPAQVRDGGYR